MSNMTRAEAQTMVEEVLAYERGELIEAVAPKSVEPIIARAAGGELDPKDLKKLAKEFIVALRQHIASTWDEELLSDPAVTKSKKARFEDGDGEGADVTVHYKAPTEVSSDDTFSLGVPQIVDAMPSAKRILGMEGLLALRRGLARALMADKKLAQRLMDQAAQSAIGSLTIVMTDYVRKDALSDLFSELVGETIDVDAGSIPADYMPRSTSSLAWPDFAGVQLTMKRLSVKLAAGNRFVKNPRGEDIPVTVANVWDVRGEIGFEVDWDAIYDAGGRAGADARKHGSAWHDVFG